MFNLTGKTALVTGATGGIGLAIAKALHGQGATVALSGRRIEQLEALKAELGERAEIFPADLADAASVDALVPAVEKGLGGLDILVNNAGITRDNLFMRMKDAEWDDILRVNLTAAFRLARGSLRGMMKKRWGRIISIASVVGVTGNPGQGNYAAAKAGLIGMSKSLAAEVASRNITVNCVAPGFIETPLTKQGLFGDPERLKWIMSRVPARRPGYPADLVGATVFLCSAASDFVTGQTLAVDGGFLTGGSWEIEPGDTSQV